MKLIIDIDERKYKIALKRKENFPMDLSRFESIIANGEPYQEWIPVSERLPEDNELVLFSTKTDRVFEGRFFSDNTDRQWYSFRDETFAWNNVVLAWMPLPEPYKAESEDKK